MRNRIKNHLKESLLDSISDKKSEHFVVAFLCLLMGCALQLFVYYIPDNIPYDTAFSFLRDGRFSVILNLTTGAFGFCFAYRLILLFFGGYLKSSKTTNNEA